MKSKIMTSLAKHKGWLIGGGAALAIYYVYKQYQANASSSAASAATNPITLAYPSTSNGTDAGYATTSTPSTASGSQATATDPNSAQMTQMESLLMAMYNQMNQPSTEPSTQSGPVVSTPSGVSVSALGVNSAGSSASIPISTPSGSATTGSIDLTPTNPTPSMNYATGQGIPTTTIKTNGNKAQNQAIIQSVTNANQYVVTDPSGNLHISSNYNAAVASAGGQNLDHTFVSGGYNSTGVFTTTNTTPQQAKATVTSATQAGHYAVQAPSGAVSEGSNYNSTVNAAGGQYINHTFVQGSYNSSGQFQAKSASGAAVYNNYEASKGSSAKANVMPATEMNKSQKTKA